METIEKLDKYLHAVFPRSIRPFGGLHRALWRPRAACSLSGSAPTPTEATRPFAFTASASSSTLTGQGATTLKLDFTLSLGRLSNYQATEDDCPWSQTVPRVSTEENGRFDTSKYVVATNDLRKCLNYERLASSPVLDVPVCGSDDSKDDERVG